MRPTEPNSPVEDLKRGVNVAVAVTEIVSFPVAVWVTKPGTWGPNYLGPTQFLGLFWPFAFVVLYGPRPEVGGVWWFWLATLGMLAVHRVCGLFLNAQRRECHSRYWGRTWLEPAGGRWTRLGRHLGSVLAAVVGLACAVLVNPAVGLLLILAGTTKLFADEAVFRASEARLRQMADARIETAYQLNEYRRRYGE